MDDYLAPRCSRYLVQTRDDLAVLRHLLVPPSAADLESCRQTWDQGRKLAHQAGARYGYILTSGSMPLHDQLR